MLRQGPCLGADTEVHLDLGEKRGSLGTLCSLAAASAAGQAHVAAQVSRLFSALLQLANNGNIVILRGSCPGQPFQLRLASLEKKHQHFQDYRAPSFLQAKVRGWPMLQSTLS